MKKAFLCQGQEYNEDKDLRTRIETMPHQHQARWLSRPAGLGWDLGWRAWERPGAGTLAGSGRVSHIWDVEVLTCSTWHENADHL